MLGLEASPFGLTDNGTMKKKQEEPLLIKHWRDTCAGGRGGEERMDLEFPESFFTSNDFLEC